MQNLMHCLFHDTHLLELFHIRFSHFQARRGSSQVSYAWQFDVKSCLRIGLGRWYLDHHLPCYKNVHTKITRIDKLNISKFIEKMKIMGFISNAIFLYLCQKWQKFHLPRRGIRYPTRHLVNILCHVGITFHDKISGGHQFEVIS